MLVSLGACYLTGCADHDSALYTADQPCVGHHRAYLQAVISVAVKMQGFAYLSKSYENEQNYKKKTQYIYQGNSYQ